MGGYGSDESAVQRFTVGVVRGRRQIMAHSTPDSTSVVVCFSSAAPWETHTSRKQNKSGWWLGFVLFGPQWNRHSTFPAGNLLGLACVAMPSGGNPGTAALPRAALPPGGRVEAVLSRRHTKPGSRMRSITSLALCRSTRHEQATCLQGTTAGTRYVFRGWRGVFRTPAACIGAGDGDTCVAHGCGREGEGYGMGTPE